MSDAVTLIEQDHRKVETLFERYRNGSREVIEQICDELTVHTAIEEKVVYPLLPQLSGGNELRREAQEEHAEVTQAVQRLRQTPPESDEVEALMETIMAGVTHHVEEEEQEVLPKLAGELGSERMATLGQELLDAKRAELTNMGALDALSKNELYEMAQAAEVQGRSDMTKDQLVDALRV